MEYACHPIKEPIKSSISLPGSRLISKLALIVASLANGVSEISGISIDNDTHTLVHALGQLGIAIQLNDIDASCIVAGCSGLLPNKQATIWCANSEAIALLLLSLCSSRPGIYSIDGSSALRQHSFSHFLSVLSHHQAQLIPSDVSHLPLTLVGADLFNGREIILDNNFTDEMISALLITAPLARSPFKFILDDTSKLSRIDLTFAMMAAFGISTVFPRQGEILLPAPQHFATSKFQIEPDMAFGVYFYAATAVCSGEILISNFYKSTSMQAEKNMLNALENMGCELIETDAGTLLKSRHPLNGADINLKEFNDSFFALVAISIFCKSPVRITRSGKMTKKESLFLKEVWSFLHSININAEEGGSWIRIFPGKPSSANIDASKNYRLGITAMIVALKSPHIKIIGAEHIANQYPDFFHLWTALTQSSNILI